MKWLLGLIAGIGLAVTIAGCGGDAAQAFCFRVCDKQKACMMDDTQCRQLCSNAHSAGCSNQSAIIAAGDACLAMDCSSYEACLNGPGPACMH